MVFQVNPSESEDKGMLGALESVKATLDDKIRLGGLKLLSGSRHTVNVESLPEPSQPKKRKEGVQWPSLEHVVSPAPIDQSPHFTALEMEGDVGGSEVGLTRV